MNNEALPLLAKPLANITGLHPPNGFEIPVHTKFTPADAAELPYDTAERADVVLFKFNVIFINTPFNNGHMLKNEWTCLRYTVAMMEY